MLKLAVLACLVAVAYATKPYFGYPLDNESIGLLGSRIAGGADASRGEFPHQVSLQWGLPPILPLSHLCGGSILNENWILTAAHCPLGVPIGDLWVKAGKHLIKTQEKNEQTVKVAKAYTHSKYTGGVGPYDISLLKLSSPLVFNEVVQPIALPQMEMIHEGDVTLSGWGSISTSQVSQMPDTLQKAELPIVEINACKKAIDALGMGSNPLHETNVCTGPLTGGVSACSGDSGGPLIKVKADGKPEVIGIVSWGIIPCGSMGAPSVYTRVSAYIDWIQSIMASHS